MTGNISQYQIIPQIPVQFQPTPVPKKKKLTTSSSSKEMKNDQSNLNPRINFLSRDKVIQQSGPKKIQEKEKIGESYLHQMQHIDRKDRR